jgi:WD40-like Beta Propeller Repeat
MEISAPITERHGPYSLCAWKLARGVVLSGARGKPVESGKRRPGGVHLGALTSLLVGTVGSICCMRAERLVAVQLDGGPEDGGPWPPFSTPTVIGGLRSDTIDVHDPSLTQDELEIYFSSETNGVFDIWTSTRAAADAPWQPAVLVSELSSPGNDLDPDVSPDGLTLYLSSDRSAAEYHLYVSRRVARDRPWDLPQDMLGLGASTLDMGPSVDPGEMLMVFASLREGPEIALYTASRGDPAGSWQAVRNMSEINSGRQDQNPALFNHGLSLVWSSRGPSNGATSDLLEASRADLSAPFSAPAPLDSLNSPTSWEGDPWLSQDGHHIVFVSDRVTGVSQIYEARR